MAEEKKREAKQAPVGAVQLISESERLVHKAGPTVFYYRRMPAQVRNRLAQRYTKRGETDWGKFLSAALKWAILDWENVVDGSGAPVPFDPELIDALPADVQLDLQELMGAKAADEEERLGN